MIHETEYQLLKITQTKKIKTMVGKNINKFFIPIGAVAIIITELMEYTIELPDFLYGFLFGLSLTFLVVGIIKQWRPSK